MLTIRSTNFGANPADIHIEGVLFTDSYMLDGEFTVDTTAPEYAGVRPMQLTVSYFPLPKNLIGTAIVTVESEGVKYATITKVWTSDSNTINIAKVLPYKSAGSYVVKLNTLLVSKKKTGAVQLKIKKRYTPVVTKGAASGLEVITVEDALGVMLVLKAQTLTFDETDNEVVMTLPDFPSGFASSFPIFYNEGLWVSLGSKYYPATLENGTLTISKSDNADEASGTGYKFTRVFIIRENDSSAGDGDE